MAKCQNCQTQHAKTFLAQCMQRIFLGPSEVWSCAGILSSCSRCQGTFASRSDHHLAINDEGDFFWCVFLMVIFVCHWFIIMIYLLQLFATTGPCKHSCFLLFRIVSVILTCCLNFCGSYVHARWNVGMKPRIAPLRMNKLSRLVWQILMEGVPTHQTARNII